ASQALRRRHGYEMQERVQAEHDEDQSKQTPGDDGQGFHFCFLVCWGLVFKPERTELAQKFLCFLPYLLFPPQLRSNKRTCDALVALSSSEVSSLIAAASPAPSSFPFSNTSPSATWTQACRPRARLCATRLPCSSLASQRSASWFMAMEPSRPVLLVTRCSTPV